MQKEEKRNAAGVDYSLYRKKVKHINLRVRKDGSVAVSIPLKLSAKLADAFVQEKRQWVLQAQAAQQHRLSQMSEPLPSPQQCMQIFEQAQQRVWGLFCHRLPQKPTITLSDMQSRWGVCYPARYQITLSRRLAQKPFEAVEYVLLHEYVHFFHPNHQKQFWEMVAQYMPDWKARRSLLKL